MTDEELRRTIIDVLCAIAPDIDSAEVEPDTDFREQFELDSMDFLNFAIALHDRLGVDIPEADYPRLATLDDAVGYLSEKLAAPTA